MQLPAAQTTGNRYLSKVGPHFYPALHPGLDYLDVVLLAETGPTLQRLIDGMYCNSIGLTINVAKSTKAEIVFPLHGSSVQGSWSVGDQVLPCAESFKYPR